MGISDQSDSFDPRVNTSVIMEGDSVQHGEERGEMLSTVVGWYSYLMVDLRDPRVDSWPLMSSIWITTAICVLYVYIVKVWGPRFMQDREPYQIKGIMLVYNLFQTLFSTWMFMEGWGFYVSGNYNWQCEPVDYSNGPTAKRAVNLAWWYFFSKFIDLFDSFFFVARKKFGHLSALHVIHHSTLPWLCWWGPRFVGGGQSGFGPFLNSGVHTVMYLYYLLAACGPQVQKYLWWKKYLTCFCVHWGSVFCPLHGFLQESLQQQTNTNKSRSIKWFQISKQRNIQWKWN